ncbi:unnamed protein product [Cochlearia groenlandica]
MANANVFLISSGNRRSTKDRYSKPKNLKVIKRSDSSSSDNNNNSYTCKKHPKHRQSPGICSICLSESLSKLSLDFYDYSASIMTSSKTVSSCSSASSESDSEYSSAAISSYYSSSVSSRLSPLQHRYSEIVVNKKKIKKHPKKQNFLSRLFL